MKLQKLTLLLFTSLLFTACGGGGGSDDDSSGDGTNFDLNISSKSCNDPMENVFDDAFFFEEELFRAINFGDAACAKKAIELGDLDVNIPFKENSFGEPELAIWKAVEKSSLFFASNDSEAFSVLKVLKEAGANLDVYNDKRESLILYALNESEPDKYQTAVQYLIKTKAINLNHRDNQSKNALYYTLNLKNKDILETLLEHKSQMDINDVASPVQNSLFKSIERNWEVGALMLLGAGAKFDEVSGRGNTALHESILKKFTKLSTSLVVMMSEENLNHQNQEGYTALHTALNENFISIADMLIDKNVDLNLVTNRGDAPVHMAIGSTLSDESIKEIINATNDSNLNSNGSRISALAQAANRQNNTIINHLLTKGLEASTVSSALLYAKDVPTAEKFLSFGADVNHSNNSGETSASQALRTNQNELFKFYISQGDFDFSWTEANTGKNLLHIATSQNKLDLMAELINSIDVNAIDNRDETPLFFIKTLEALNLLDENNADINVQNKVGHNPLASYYLDYSSTNQADSYITLIKRFIELGADTNSVSTEGRPTFFNIVDQNSPLRDELRVAVLEELLKTDLDLQVIDSSGNSALYYSFSAEIISMLVIDGSTLNKANHTSINSNGRTVLEYYDGTLFSAARLETVLLEEIAEIEEILENSNPGDADLLTQRLATLRIRNEINSKKIKDLTAVIALIESL